MPFATECPVLVPAGSTFVARTLSLRGGAGGGRGGSLLHSRSNLHLLQYLVVDFAVMVQLYFSYSVLCGRLVCGCSDVSMRGYCVAHDTIGSMCRLRPASNQRAAKRTGRSRWILADWNPGAEDTVHPFHMHHGDPTVAG